MNRKKVAVLTLFILLLMNSVRVLAHHGTAAFDMVGLTTIKGTVTKFDFMNPHSLIYVDVAGDQGKIENWVAEESSNNHLSRVGWEKNTLKAGDQVTITGHRAKNGAHALELQCTECSVTDSGGKVLPPG
jgi:Family of unknown function (DUF6152)